MADLLPLFRQLSSFEPPRGSLHGAPWVEYVDWAIANGLAPLAAYNLEYRLAGAGAPEWARDRLLSVYQGSLNDNVMKLVNFKRAVNALEGRKVVLLDAASFAEALYPHVAFRPVADLHLWVRPEDLDGFTGFLAESEFKPQRAPDDLPPAARVLSDGRTFVLLHTDWLGGRDEGRRHPVLERALPMRVYGPSVFRLGHEDALLSVCLAHARAGFDVPMISFVDLRELLLGAPSLGGPYSQPLQSVAVLERAKAFGMERALYASLQVAAHLFPETRDVVARTLPDLRASSRALLDRLVVEPLSGLGKVRSVRGAARLRRLLVGS